MGIEGEPAIVAPVEQQKWPTHPKPQLTAIPTYSAPAAANGQSYKSPANSLNVTLRKTTVREN
jgi:hypothetical protein